jgi:DNA-binding IscR family transcriptional regulator
MNPSRQEEIAICVLVACAQAEGRRIQTGTVAAAANASIAHTSRIVHRLMRAGLLDTLRGRHGGIRLAAGVENLSLGTVLNRFGERRRRSSTAVRAGGDPLSAIASAAEAQAAQAFESFTIADLAADRVDEKLACFQCTIRLGALRRPPLSAASPGAHPGA